MRVRSAVLQGMGAPRPYAESAPLRITELELAPPGPGELLIRIGAAGLCHSDLSVIDGSRPRPLPMALGHEAAGTVVATGGGGSAFAEGDHVVLTFVPACGTCEPCVHDRAALCEPGAAANAAGELLGGGGRLSTLRGESVRHHLGISAFSDHVVVSERSAVKVDPAIPFEIAALFGCAVLTGVGAALNAISIAPGDDVVVFGLGGVGLSALLGAVYAGARVTAVDPAAEKHELALSLGAHAALAPSPDVVAELRERTGGGAPYVIETVGRAAVLGQAYAATRRGGTTVTVGLPAPDDALSIPAVSLTAEERTLKGSYLGSSVPARDIPRFVGLYQEGRLPVDRLLTHRLTLDEIHEGFDRLAAGVGVRQAIIF